MDIDKLEQLKHSDGASVRIVAVFIDIRDFTAFAEKSESSDTASYLISAYVRILESYFPDCDYFRPTGDGLLVVFETTGQQDDVAATMTMVIEKAQKLVTEFGELTGSNDVINFVVPTAAGVGIARGSATKLVADGVILDYSGRCLNLAARLLNLARPQGVVIHEVHPESMIRINVREEFDQSVVYLKGLGSTPIQVLSTSGLVDIPDWMKQPPHTEKWFPAVEGNWTRGRLADAAKTGFMFVFSSEPPDGSTPLVHAEWSTYKNGRTTGGFTWKKLPARIIRHPDGVYARVDGPEFVKLERIMESQKAPLKTPIVLRPGYSI